MSLLAMFERVDNVPQGRAGGAPGAPGRVALRSGARLRSKGAQPVPAGETLIMETPGGGGYGDPANRAAERAGEAVLPEETHPGRLITASPRECTASFW